jgi:filamentous hemagglutinin
VLAQIGEGALKLLGGQSQVFLKTPFGARVVDQLVNSVANEAKVGRAYLTMANELAIAKEVWLRQEGQIVGSVWNFFESPVTGKMGPSPALAAALRAAGIEIR